MSSTRNRVPQWRKLGKPVEKAMTAEEAIKLGGLDFNVKVSEDFVGVTVNNQLLKVDNKFITYAEYADGKTKALGVVGNRYTPIQNTDAFDLLNNIVDESGANFDSAGTLNGGQRCYITMKMPNTIKVANGGDAIETYLNCMNSHDGSSSFTIHTTFLRLVCTNGMKGFVQGSSINLRHTANAVMKVQEAREALQIVFQQQEEFQTQVEALLNTEMSNSQYKKFVEALVPEAPEDASVRKSNSVDRVRGDLMGLWTAPTQEIVKNTAWAAYSAVVEYVDWFKPVRGGESAELQRAERNLTGQSRLKEKARELLLA